MPDLCDVQIKNGQFQEPKREDTGIQLPYSAAVSKDHSLVAVSVNKDVRLYRTSDLKEAAKAPVLRLDSPADKESYCASSFSSDGKRLAISSDKGTVGLYKVETKGDETSTKELYSYSIQPVANRVPEVKAIQWHPDGGHIVAACDDGAWRVWSTKNDKLILDSALPVYTPENVSYICRHCRFSPNGKNLYTIHFAKKAPRGFDRSSYITKWNVEIDGSGRLVLTAAKVAKASPDSVISMAVSGDGSQVALGTGEGEVVVMDGASLSIRSKKQLHTMGITELAFSPVTEGNRGKPMYIVSAGGDFKLSVFQAPSSSSFFGNFLLLLLLLSLVYAYLYFIDQEALSVVESYFEFVIKHVRTEFATVTGLLGSST